jgi:hypothetical protein
LSILSINSNIDSRYAHDILITDSAAPAPVLAAFEAERCDSPTGLTVCPMWRTKSRVRSVCNVGEPGVIGLAAKMAICVVVVGVLAGCTPAPPEGSTASTVPPTATSPLAVPAGTPLPPSPPPIARPLDASRYATKDTVCGLLTDTQAVEVGLQGSGNPYAGDGGLLTCNRNGFGTERDVEYNLWSDSDVFASQFGDRRRQSGDDARLMDIAGQPAVVNGSDPKPACLVTVGLAERQGIEVLASDGKDLACAVAVAERMVRNIAG